MKKTKEELYSLNFEKIANGKHIKMVDVFENEKDMIDNLSKMLKFDKDFKIDKIRTNKYLKNLSSNIDLTKPQITQIKRNAYVFVDYYINILCTNIEAQKEFEKIFKIN